MAQIYSLDLRKKTMNFLRNKGSIQEAQKIFGIGQATVYRWIKKEKSGNLAAKKRTDFPRKINLPQLYAYVAEHPDHTITEIAQALNLGRTTIFMWLKTLKLTRKKKRRCTKKGMKKNVMNTQLP